MGVPANTYDRLLSGAVAVVQPVHGYRAGLDALVLAASLCAKPGQYFFEAGTGSGAALLCAAHRLPEVRFRAVDKDAEALMRAQEGVGLNGFDERIALHCMNIENPIAEWENQFDGAFANPPYLQPDKTRRLAPEREDAMLAITPLSAWIRFLLYVVRRGAYIYLIHRAAMLSQILDGLESGAGQIEILPLHPAPGLPARRVLVRARKGLRVGENVLHHGIALYDESGGEPSTQLRAIEAGGALEWGNSQRL